MILASYDIARRQTTLRPDQAAAIERSRAERIQLALTDDFSDATLGEDASLKFTLKEKGKRRSAPLLTITLTADDLHENSKTYRQIFDAITAGVNALLGVDTEGNTITSKPTEGQFSYRESDDDEWQDGDIFDVTLTLAVRDEEDNTPVREDTPEDWLNARAIRYLPSVVGLTGGGNTKLDGLATLLLSAGNAIALMDDDAGSVVRIYELVAGTDEEDSPNVIRPDDYDEDTNAQVWMLRNASAGGAFLPLVGGIMEDDAAILWPNGAGIVNGISEEGGAGGVSLQCAVNYFLNWQAGVLRAYEADGETIRPLYLGSTLEGHDLLRVDADDARILLNSLGSPVIGMVDDEVQLFDSLTGATAGYDGSGLFNVSNILTVGFGGPFSVGVDGTVTLGSGDQLNPDGSGNLGAGSISWDGDGNFNATAFTGDASGLDFSGVDFASLLNGFDASVMDLSSVDWSQVDASQVDFSSADLSGVDLSDLLNGFDASVMDFSGVSAGALDFSSVNLDGATFESPLEIGDNLTVHGDVIVDGTLSCLAVKDSGGDQVLGDQQPSIAVTDGSGGSVQDLQARAAIDAIITALRNHGIIASP